MHTYRTHTCGELRVGQVGSAVRLSGWLRNRRDHWGVYFIDLADHYGATQLVVAPGSDMYERVIRLPKETVIRVDGTVQHREEGKVNPQMPTGEIEIKGRKLDPRHPRGAIEVGIGYLSEDRKREGLLLQQSLYDNAMLTRRAFAQPLRQPTSGDMSADEAERQLRQLDVRAGSFEQEARLLSGGNPQKVIIARWLARDPDILLFCEPTRSVDVAAKAAIYKIMRDLASRGRGILMISSDLPEVIGVSDRMIVMRQGAIAGECPGGAGEEDVMSIAVGHGREAHAPDS